MPTWSMVARFTKDLELLDPSDRARFSSAVAEFVADLKAGQGFRAGLRVKRVQGTSGVFEMTFSGDGRATWEYGPEEIPGEPHVIWRRVGTHDIFRMP